MSRLTAFVRACTVFFHPFPLFVAVAHMIQINHLVGMNVISYQFVYCGMQVRWSGFWLVVRKIA